MVQLSLQKYYENILMTTAYRWYQGCFLSFAKGNHFASYHITFFLNFSCNLMPSALSFSHVILGANAREKKCIKSDEVCTWTRLQGSHLKSAGNIKNSTNGADVSLISLLIKSNKTVVISSCWKPAFVFLFLKTRSHCFKNGWFWSGE